MIETAMSKLFSMQLDADEGQNVQQVANSTTSHSLKLGETARLTESKLGSPMKTIALFKLDANSREDTSQPGSNQ